MADSNNDLLATLRRHNKELERLLSPEGKEELDRLIKLEHDLSVHTADQLRKLSNIESSDTRRVRLSTGRPRDGDSANKDMVVALWLPGPVNDILEKIRSRINSYIADKVGGIAGAGDKDADDT